MSTPPGTGANPDRACPHEDFHVQANIGRIEPDSNGMPKAFICEISVSCQQCGEPFRFTGVPAGLSFAHPMVDVAETTLHAPVRPASADPDFGMGLPGYAIRRAV
jgi:hypothetical protein